MVLVFEWVLRKPAQGKPAKHKKTAVTLSNGCLLIFRSETLKKDYFLEDESKRSSNGDEVSATYLAPGVSLSTTLPFLT